MGYQSGLSVADSVTLSKQCTGDHWPQGQPWSRKGRNGRTNDGGYDDDDVNVNDDDDSVGNNENDGGGDSCGDSIEADSDDEGVDGDVDGNTVVAVSIYHIL